MTRTTKAAQIQELKKRLENAEHALTLFGYECHPMWHIWEKTAAQLAKEASLQRNRSDADFKQGRAAGKQDALELVLKALKITYLETYGEKATPAERFEADLRTAIRVREEKAKSDRDAATERRVANLTKPASTAFTLTLDDQLRLRDMWDATNARPAKKSAKKTTKPKGEKR